ncbi:MAG: hypothetical protein ACPHAS_07645 [Synechococcus sp.]
MLLSAAHPLGHNDNSRTPTMEKQTMHQFAVTYHCGENWGEEMLESEDLSHAVQEAHAIFPGSCRISIRELTNPPKH